MAHARLLDALEFNSFRRKTRSKALHELKLHRQEKFLYICDMLHMWEWDVRVLDIEGADGDHFPICLSGSGAAPPEHCGGPTGSVRSCFTWRRSGPR